MFDPLLARLPDSSRPDRAGPVRFRMVLAHSERVAGLTAQNAVAHNEGLGAK